MSAESCADSGAEDFSAAPSADAMAYRGKREEKNNCGLKTTREISRGKPLTWKKSRSILVSCAVEGTSAHACRQDTYVLNVDRENTAHDESFSTLFFPRTRPSAHSLDHLAQASVCGSEKLIAVIWRHARHSQRAWRRCRGSFEGSRYRSRLLQRHRESARAGKQKRELKRGCDRGRSEEERKHKKEDGPRAKAQYAHACSEELDCAAPAEAEAVAEAEEEDEEADADALSCLMSASNVCMYSGSSERHGADAGARDAASRMLLQPNRRKERIYARRSNTDVNGGRQRQEEKRST